MSCDAEHMSLSGEAHKEGLRGIVLGWVGQEKRGILGECYRYFFNRSPSYFPGPVQISISRSRKKAEEEESELRFWIRTTSLVMYK